MKRYALTMLMLAMISTSTACIIAQPEPGETEEWEVGENNNTGNNNTQTQEAPELDAVFVAGHLGNYMDCPGDGYSENTSSADEPARGAPAGDFAPCEPVEGEDTCNYGPLNCEAAQFTINITNDGQLAAQGVSIDSIAMLDVDGNIVATLPLIDAVDANTGEAFDGNLAVGEEITLRVDYQGPEDISEFIPSENRWSGSAKLRITIGADNHEDVRVETKAVSVLPAVVT
ncbi:MAG: hypothetical protein VYE40_03145 [Myxococcota bacterium]|nr:hypothetical protein [Myxococcota bacterium]